MGIGPVTAYLTPTPTIVVPKYVATATVAPADKKSGNKDDLKVEDNYNKAFEDLKRTVQKFESDKAALENMSAVEKNTYSDKYCTSESTTYQALAEAYKAKKAYFAAKADLINTAAALTNKLENCSLSPQEKLKLVPRLYSYDEVIRSTVPVSDVLPEIRNVICPPTGTIKGMNDILLEKGSLEITPEQLPIEVVNILKAVKMRDGKDYYQYVKENVNSIIFVPDVASVMNMKEKNAIGAPEELSKTIVISSLDAYHASKRKAYEIARTIVAETAHVEWFHMNEDTVGLLNVDPNERYSNIIIYDFYKSLIGSKVPLSQDEKDYIVNGWGGLNMLEGTIRDYNRIIGYPLNDFSFRNDLPGR